MRHWDPEFLLAHDTLRGQDYGIAFKRTTVPSTTSAAQRQAQNPAQSAGIRQSESLPECVFALAQLFSFPWYGAFLPK